MGWFEITDFELPFRLNLPDGWLEQEWSSGPSYPGHGREFRPPGETKAILSVWSRGFGMKKIVADALCACLEAPPHDLSAAEVQAVRPGLGNMEHPTVFAVRSAHTADIAGRRALAVEGNWLEIDNDCYEIFVPLSSDCRTLQEVYFQAPPVVYAKHIDSIKNALASLQWL